MLFLKCKGQSRTFTNWGGGAGVACFQVEHGGHHVHPLGWIPPVLAPEADADATDDHEWRLQVWLARMG